MKLKPASLYITHQIIDLITLQVDRDVQILIWEEIQHPIRGQILPEVQRQIMQELQLK